MVFVLAVSLVIAPLQQVRADDNVLEIPRTYNPSVKRDKSRPVSAPASDPEPSALTEYEADPSTSPPPRDLSSARDYLEQSRGGRRPVARSYSPAPSYSAPSSYSSSGGSYGSGYDPYGYDPYGYDPYSYSGYASPGSLGHNTYGPSGPYGDEQNASNGLDWGALIVGGLMVGLAVAEISSSHHRHRR